jgi:uroporphyrinogen decarboxylase
VFRVRHHARLPRRKQPSIESKLIEETNAYRITTSAWGATMKNWKHVGSTPDFPDFTIVDRDSWAAAKERIQPEDDRLDWAKVEENYNKWGAEGAWITVGGWFGYDILASWTVGTERMLMAMVSDPDWAADMCWHLLETQLALYDKAWERG